MLRRLVPYLLFAILGLLFFADLLFHLGWVLYSDSSDLLALHLPVKRFLVQSWQETGELPMWCPYSFGGLPLLHDVQTAAFYPPHLLLYGLPVDGMGVALSWLVVAHVILAGGCMWAYARSQGLTGAGAAVAAVGYMFAGRWLLHVLAGGHYILVPLAWLPLVLLCLERSIAPPQATSFLRRLIWATAAGTIFALILVGTHPQLTFYAGIFAALWTLIPAVEAGWNARALVRWLGFGAWAAAIAVGLGAVQLLPALEAAPLSSRSLGVATWADIFQAGPRVLLFLVGPALTVEPVNLQWEDRGGLALLWLAAAAMAPLLGGRRVRWQAGICLLLFLLALGGAAAVQGLPGFRLFRQPARILIVAGLPIALLAGWTTQKLLELPAAAQETRQRCRRILVRVAVAVLILAGGFALRQALQGLPLRFHIYWPSLLLTVPAAWWLLGRGLGEQPWLRWAWAAVLGLDLMLLTWPLVQARPEEVVSAPSKCVDFLRTALADNHDRVLDVPGQEDLNSPLGTGAHQALRWHLEPVRGYNSFDLLRYKEYLHLVAGGDGAIVPFESPLTYPDIGPLPVQNRALLDLLGVRYIVQPADLPAEQGWKEVFLETTPAAYDFGGGGRRPLPAYRIYENLQALPRALVVPVAAPLLEGDPVLPQLMATDLRQCVLLEGDIPAAPASSSTQPRAARIREYLPNRITVDVADGPAGFLVLTDPSFPGWTAQVGGKPVAVQRGDFLFRAVAVPAGAQQVVFAFAPTSVASGAWISVATLGGVIVLFLVAALLPLMRKGHKGDTKPASGNAD